MRLFSLFRTSSFLIFIILARLSLWWQRLTFLWKIKQSIVNAQSTTSASRKAKLAPVAILFSGGLDSMILAALLDECLDACCKCLLVLLSKKCLLVHRKSIFNF